MTDRATVTGRTALLAILGDPVEQARAPALVNASLAARGCDAVMVAPQMRAAALPRVVGGLRAIERLRGGVVTMPHKEAVVPLLDDVLLPATAR